MNFIGLMSGTSLDGVDGVLVQFEGEKCAIVQHSSKEFATDLRANLLSLNTPSHDELHQSAIAANALADVCAQVVADLLLQSGCAPSDIRAVGAHGQTVRHRPLGFDASSTDATAYTIQLNNPSRLAERCGIDVVADFRSRDVAAGGQGAPLVPAFHQAVFSHADPQGAVLNLGGIGNITLLDPASEVAGFDCGPGNALLDYWCHVHTGAAYDNNGAWGANGQVNHALLDSLLADAYFARKPPKSTGRDAFNPTWLNTMLAGHGSLAAQDVQATLVELTVRSVRSAVCLYAPNARVLVVCGGGAFNGHLMQRLGVLLPTVRVQKSDAWGIAAQQVEAAAFAWLARQFVLRLPGNLPKATGAKGSRVLGALYPC